MIYVFNGGIGSDRLQHVRWRVPRVDFEQLGVNRATYVLNESNRYRIADLPHQRLPRPDKLVVIRECLKPGALPNGEVSDSAVGAHQNVFTSRYAVCACLQRLGWHVKGATGVARVDSRPWDQYMIRQLALVTFYAWERQIRERVTNRSPGKS